MTALLHDPGTDGVDRPVSHLSEPVQIVNDLSDRSHINQRLIGLPLFLLQIIFIYNRYFYCNG